MIRGQMIRMPRPSGCPSVLGALSLVLAGCAAAPTPTPDAVLTEAPNAVQTRSVTATHSVRLGEGEAVLDAAQIADLRNFLQATDASQGTPVQVRTAAGDQDRAAPMIAALHALGFQPTLSSDSTIAPGEVRLVIESVVASAPACPNWSRPPGNDAANAVHSDFGCASAANLAAMVADPRDLMVGRALKPASGDAAVAAIARYRQGVSPSTVAGPSPVPGGSLAAVSGP
jgi:pilus assembly protein CpaD